MGNVRIISNESNSRATVSLVAWEMTAATAAPAAASGPLVFDAAHYRERNTVERCFSKLKQFRAVATRNDKREQIYQGTVDVASIRIWLKDPVP